VNNDGDVRYENATVVLSRHRLAWMRYVRTYVGRSQATEMSRRMRSDQAHRPPVSRTDSR
jgi:hypothetical protein